MEKFEKVLNIDNENAKERSGLSLKATVPKS